MLELQENLQNHLNLNGTQGFSPKGNCKSKKNIQRCQLSNKKHLPIISLPHRRRINTYRREGKGYRCYLGDVLECSKDDQRKTFWKNIYFGRLVIHFSEASIPPSVRSSIHPFLLIILVLFLLCGIELNQFPSLCLLFCLYPSTVHNRRTSSQGMHGPG